MGKLKMSDVISKEGYKAFSAVERKQILKVEQAKEHSGLRAYPSTCSAVFADIPADWWSKYSAEHIGEVARLLHLVYQRGQSDPVHREAI